MSFHAELSWAQYDAAYCRQAANTGDRRWSQINSPLYVICFTGRAQGAQRCELCASVFHPSKDCLFSTTRRKWRRHWRQCWLHAAPELVVAAPRLALALARVTRFAGSGTTTGAITRGAAIVTFVCHARAHTL